jgi:hypothetical protein
VIHHIAAACACRPAVCRAGMRSLERPPGHRVTFDLALRIAFAGAAFRSPSIPGVRAHGPAPGYGPLRTRNRAAATGGHALEHRHTAIVPSSIAALKVEILPHPAAPGEPAGAGGAAEPSLPGAEIRTAAPAGSRRAAGVLACAPSCAGGWPTPPDAPARANVGQTWRDSGQLSSQATVPPTSSHGTQISTSRSTPPYCFTVTFSRFAEITNSPPTTDIWRCRRSSQRDAVPVFEVAGGYQSSDVS